MNPPSPGPRPKKEILKTRTPIHPGEVLANEVIDIINVLRISVKSKNHPPVGVLPIPPSLMGFVGKGETGYALRVVSDIKPEPGHEGILELLGAGSDIAGSVAGAAVGLMVAGPAGGLVGSGLGSGIGYALKKLGNEIYRRMLAPREQKRIGSVIAFGIQHIKEKLAAGEKVRVDGFFDSQPDSRSAADEVFEGVILAAQREYEEKKLPFMGKLMANLAFRSDIDRGYANYLVRLGESLSYRQLGLLVMFAVQDKSRYRTSDYRTTQQFPPTLLGLLHEAYDLEQRGLIASGSTSFGPNDIVPGKANTQGAGVELVNLMKLANFPPADFNALTSVLA